LDDCHYNKNGKSKRTTAAKLISKFSPQVIAVSGTPIENRPVEIYNPVWIVNRMLFGNYMNFVLRYCGAKKNQYGWDVSGSSNVKELHEKLINSVMIRRKKADVLKDLPDKIFSFVPFKMDNQNEYDKAEKDVIYVI
jgi:SWI/SNF-related matrix-associated actin-dependent regulator 1 of chromatin subfamily A